MIGQRDRRLLRDVSRSFHLSLRLLPGPMREAAGLAYLLARASDTIADVKAPAEVRLPALDSFGKALDERGEWSPDGELLVAVTHAGERRLLESVTSLLRELDRMPRREAELIREVVATILGGQRLDIERFETNPAARIVALADADELEDYTWRVAGCVGAFWTDLGFLTLGNRFSTAAPEELRNLGVSYGKGLQLVNILRDLPEDHARGRCYLPVADPADKPLILRERDRLLETAAERMDDGISYARALESRRSRASAAMPAMIGRETIGLMRGADWETLAARVKVPRPVIYRLLLRGLAGAFG